MATQMTKRELSRILLYWGLRVEGDEKRYELDEAFHYFLKYLRGHNMPVVYPATVDNSRAARYAQPQMVGTSSPA
jgi:hypothetical protein